MFTTTEKRKPMKTLEGQVLTSKLSKLLHHRLYLVENCFALPLSHYHSLEVRKPKMVWRKTQRCFPRWHFDSDSAFRKIEDQVLRGEVEVVDIAVVAAVVVVVLEVMEL